MARRSVDVIVKGKDKATPAFSSAKAALAGIAGGAGFGLASAGAKALTQVFKQALASAKEMVFEVVDLGDQFEKFSRSTGISSEVLSGLKFAADKAGSSFERIKIGLKTFTQAAFESAKGVKTYKELFDKLGVSVLNNEGNLKDINQLFLETADGTQALTNNTERLAIASKLFGRSGLELLPILTEGSEGIRELLAEARELGVIFSQEDAVAAAEFKDALTELDAVLLGLKKDFVIDILPTLILSVDLFRDMAKESKSALVSVFKFGEKAASVLKFAGAKGFIFAKSIEAATDAGKGLAIVNKLIHNSVIDSTKAEEDFNESLLDTQLILEKNIITYEDFIKKTARAAGIADLVGVDKQLAQSFGREADMIERARELAEKAGRDPSLIIREIKEAAEAERDLLREKERSRVEEEGAARTDIFLEEIRQQVEKGIEFRDLAADIRNEFEDINLSPMELSIKRITDASEEQIAALRKLAAESFIAPSEQEIRELETLLGNIVARREEDIRDLFRKERDERVGVQAFEDRFFRFAAQQAGAGPSPQERQLEATKMQTRAIEKGDEKVVKTIKESAQNVTPFEAVNVVNL